MAEIIALICILGAIILLIAGLVRVLSPDTDSRTDTTSAFSAPPSPTPAARPEDPSRRKASANEQSYYQFTAPTPAPCPSCGCENNAGTATCQVCGKPLSMRGC